ncbi:Uncharacterized protein OBRU01_18141, partial [Operophtera brumata]
MSCVSAQSASSCGSRETLAVGAGEVRRRLEHATQAPPPNAFKHDPHDPSATALKTLAVGAGEVRRRLEHATQAPPPNAFKHDPHDPSATALK